MGSRNQSSLDTKRKLAIPSTRFNTIQCFRYPLQVSECIPVSKQGLLYVIELYKRKVTLNFYNSVLPTLMCLKIT